MSTHPEQRAMSPRYPLASTGIRFFRPESGAPATPGITLALLITFLILLYANTPFVMPSLEVVRPAKLVAAAALLALLVQSFFGQRRLEFAWPEGFLLICFLAAASLSCLSALWPRHSMEATLDLAKMVLVYFLIVNCAKTKTTLRTVMWTLLAGGLFPAAGTWKNYLAGNLIEGRAAWVGIFANPNEVAYGLVILLPLAGYLAVDLGWTGRLALAGIAAVYLGAIFMTFSRGGLVALAAMAVVFAWRRRSIWMYALIALCLAGVLGMAGKYWSRGEDFSQLKADASFQQRIATSQAGVNMFLDHPLTGVGLSCSVIAWPLYAPPGLYTRGALVSHNTVIQLLSETGIVGFVPFALFFFFGLRAARKLSKSPETAALGTGIEVALWGVLACGMSGGYVLTWFPYILLGLASAASRASGAGR